MTATRPLLAILALALACGPEAQTEAPSEDSEARLDDIAVSPSATVIEYATAIQFLSLQPSSTRGLVLELANTSLPEGLNHHYSAWRLTGAGWRKIFDTRIQEQPTRAPWRIFPTDSLRLTVNADGDVDALVLRSTGGEYALDLGDRLDAWEDRSGARHVIRQAVLTRGSERVTGMLVDHRLVVPEPDQPTRLGPFERAVVRSNDGAVLILFNTREPEAMGEPFAWMYADGLNRRWTTVETRTIEVANSSQLRRNVPVRISFYIPEAGIRGELTATERDFEGSEAEEGPRPYTGLYRMRGWIEFAGERRDLEGIYELGEP